MFLSCSLSVSFISWAACVSLAAFSAKTRRLCFLKRRKLRAESSRIPSDTPTPAPTTTDLFDGCDPLDKDAGEADGAGDTFLMSKG